MRWSAKQWHYSRCTDVLRVEKESVFFILMPLYYRGHFQLYIAAHTRLMSDLGGLYNLQWWTLCAYDAVMRPARCWCQATELDWERVCSSIKYTCSSVSDMFLNTSLMYICLSCSPILGRCKSRSGRGRDGFGGGSLQMNGAANSWKAQSPTTFSPHFASPLRKSCSSSGVEAAKENSDALGDRTDFASVEKKSILAIGLYLVHKNFIPSHW